MSGSDDEQQQLIREARMDKGKQATTASSRRERVEQNLYVPKTRKRRDPRVVGDSSKSQMDYSSQVLDPTEAHDYVGYAGGFEGYSRMEEDNMFYQPREEEAGGEEEGEDEEVPDDVEADYLTTDDIVLEA